MSRITKITRKKIIDQRLYNFAVDGDESYICNGIVVHNCKSYVLPILKGNLGEREITKLQPSSQELEKFVQFHEGNCCCGNGRIMMIGIDQN